MFWDYKASKRNFAAYLCCKTYRDIMLRSFLLLIFFTPLCANPCAAMAQGFVPITDKADFMARIADRKLQLGLFDLSIIVKVDGLITGTALGWQVTGDWEWKSTITASLSKLTLIRCDLPLMRVRGGRQVSRWNDQKSIARPFFSQSP